MAITDTNHTEPVPPRLASAHSSDARLATTGGKKRTRTGCRNCRRKRRKCDEAKPTCAGCQARRETCEWGMKLSFRPENAQCMKLEHPSMRQAAMQSKAHGYQIVDVTSEVIRDYLEESVPPAFDSAERQESWHAAFHTVPAPDLVDRQAAVDLVRLSRSRTATTPSPPAIPAVPRADTLPNLSPQFSDSVFEDGIFLPGSQYQELHAQLRSRIIDTARSTVPSRFATPDIAYSDQRTATDYTASVVDDEDEESRRLAHLSPEQEYPLWQNYINEVASWLDKFDNERHFELVLPMLAKSHSHLKYAILALSARQIERKEQTLDYSCSLALYQHAIHLLSPLLQRRSAEVLASCVVLCVLEMLSCSPKAWRRHLDGCAALIQAMCISGTSGGLEQALFWTFTRMDVCGGLISSERTLIPVQTWMGGADVLADITMLQAHNRSDMCANHVVYLCGCVVDLLCSSGKWEQRGHRHADVFDIMNYNSNWTRLFDLVENWYRSRPDDMKPLIVIPSTGQDPAKPFPTVLFGNPSATSGNQMYHTAALMMLKHKPAHVQFTKRTHSMLWHARQICAISISNAHHGCWTNSVQPLWLAGQQMSHLSEHRAILEIYGRIERETGWATRWRADDLRVFWGDMET